MIFLYLNVYRLHITQVKFYSQNKNALHVVFQKKRPPPTFGPISCLGSKFTQSGLHLGASFA